MSFSAMGKQLRLRQLENAATGKSVIVAMDHGLNGVPEGFGVPGPVLSRVIAARPDGLLVTAGMAAANREALAGAGLPLVIGVDFPIWESGRALAVRLGTTVETAMQVGAHCIKAILLMDAAPGELSANLQYIAGLAARCEACGIPLMVEPVAWDWERTEPERAGRAVLDGCRVAVEMGADVLKVGAVGGSQAVLLEAVRNAPVPVTVLGGARRDPESVLAEVRVAAEAGAWGAVVGRNVWQHPEPELVVRGLAQALGAETARH
ncbi:MAG: DhnA-type fructose6-bisphosphate aldolase-related enzyme [Firmicutes bacterium]|nr:DhnA-type fructose6-bisphosphate aldolase-related enzyme [Bacillota bacterium]